MYSAEAIAVQPVIDKDAAVSRSREEGDLEFMERVWTPGKERIFALHS